MGDESVRAEGGWFTDVSPADIDGASEVITDGTAETPRDWPARAVSAGYVDSEPAATPRACHRHPD